MSTTPDRLRVLHIVESAGAGVGRHVADLVEGLLRHGDMVDVAYGSERADGEFRRRIEELEPNALAELPMRRRPGLGDVATQLRLDRFVREHGPYDVIHGHASKGGLHARLTRGAAARFYTPNAFVTQSPGLNRFERAAYVAAERGLARRTHGLVVVSVEEAQHAERLRLRPADVRVIANGVDRPCLPDRGTARAKLGLTEADTVIGFVGRLTAQKGVERLIDAIALVPPDGSTTWVIIGGGEQADSLRAQAARVGVTDRVRWLGARPGQASMPAFDLFVLPSHYEGFPYVALEALQAGVPVIATNTSSVNALLADGRAGRIVDGTPAAIAEAVIDALGHRAALANWAAAATEVASGFTAASMVAATRRFYLDVVRPASKVDAR